ncbi:MAG TPA: S8 family peptidase [Myxococcota bacterium]|nr:S8 family peptidase [Myxococcota bacterium]
MPTPRDRLPHITIPDHLTETRRYTYAQRVRGSTKHTAPADAASHGAKLKGDLQAAAVGAARLAADRAAAGVAADQGIVLEFESEPGFELALASLDRARDGIELLSVRERDPVMLATVLVPDGKLVVFEKLVEQYTTEQTARGRPKNAPLVANIAEIRLAVLESLWTDAGDLPDLATPIWWEVWLRQTDTSLSTFRQLAGQHGIRVGDRHLQFVDRQVVLVYASGEQLRSSVGLLDTLAELRRAKELASFFDALPAREQADWTRALSAGAPAVSIDAPAVCLLDTGVNRGHPLLSPYLDPSDLHAVDPAWGTADHRGHGTEMAGLATWGDLAPALAGDVKEPPEHILESVVLLPPRAATPTPPELYGSYTTAAVALPEIAAPLRPRVFCLTVTTDDGRDLGRPSSWSAELDVLCHGRRDESPPRLVVVSAGNVDQARWPEYPDVNDTDRVHDPGQAWNALTVGAMTHKAWFDPAERPDWRAIAPPGGLSPSSTTSVGWLSRWPNKPDIVFEGGNAAVSPAGDVDLPSDLRLLTTSARIPLRLFDTTGDTSGATALAARMAVRLMVTYPSFWPETIRALIVHSARWTPAMRASVPRNLARTNQLRTLVRRYGWGEPDFTRAAVSASNALTLVAERVIQPYENVADPDRAPDVKTKDWHLFKLPWPRDALLDLGEQQVELRVTLSFFVEPNPGRRGQLNRHMYPSCALRVAMQNSTESLDDFRKRISKVEQDEEAGHAAFSEPGWQLGPSGRNRGSILSDTWIGTAASLATREHLAVHPTGGWWRYNRKEQRWNDRARYALVVSVYTPDTDVDIYTPVATQVGIAINV